MHLFTQHEKPYDRYDAQQEREQLDKTLLSLMQYYEDSRGRLESPNEAEFRAYGIVKAIQDKIPDVEDRVQMWPSRIIQDRRVQKALELYTAASNTTDPQGPLKPATPHPIAQADWRRFWRLIDSNQVCYVMACVAEMYFTTVRQTTMNAIWTAYRASARKREDGKMGDHWTLPDLVEALGFGGEEQGDYAVKSFCEAYGLTLDSVEGGTEYVDLSSVSGTRLPDPNRSMQTQGSNWSVEGKRHGRMLCAVISGMSVKGAREAGMVEEEPEGMDQGGENESMFWGEDEGQGQGQGTDDTQVQGSGSIATSSQQKQQTDSLFNAAPLSSAAEEPQEQAAAPRASSNPFSKSAPSFGFGQQYSPSSQQPLPSFGISQQATSEKTGSQTSSPSSQQSAFTATSGSGTPKPTQPSTLFSTQPAKSDQPSASDNPKPFAYLPTTPKAPTFNWSKPSVQNDNADQSTSPQPSQNQPFQSSQTSTPSFTPPTQPSFSFAKPADQAGFPPTQPDQTQSNPFAPPQTSQQTPASLQADSYKNPFAPKRASPLSQAPLFPASSASLSSTSSAPSAQPPSQPSSPFTFSSSQAPAQKESAPSANPFQSPPAFQQAPAPKPRGPSQAELDAQRRTEAEATAKRKARDSETLDQLAREMVLGPWGFLEQYVAVTAPNIIASVRARVEVRKDIQRAGLSPHALTTMFTV